jgi:hypothetical protein
MNRIDLSAHALEPQTPELAFALARFAGERDAVATFAAACDRCGGVPWLRELVTVERHSQRRMVLRGTVPGERLDVNAGNCILDGAGDVSAPTALLGSPALALGLLAGATAGPLPETVAEPADLLSRMRDAVPVHSSALALIAPWAELGELLTCIDERAAAFTSGALVPDAQRPSWTSRPYTRGVGHFAA